MRPPSTRSAGPEQPASPPSAGAPDNGERVRAVAALLIIVVLVVGGLGYVLATDHGLAVRPPDLLADGGFESGGLLGWQSVPPYLPAVESSVVPRGASYAARFQTPTNDPSVSDPCLTAGTGCGLLNVSTIYQTLDNLTVYGDTRLALAVYPAFQYPSALQVTLEFGVSPSVASHTSYTDVLLYYLVLASTQQCSSFSGYLLRTHPAGTVSSAQCLSAPQGEWTFFSRDLVSDLPPGVILSDLGGSTMTLSVSFAGAGPADEVCVGSLYLG